MENKKTNYGWVIVALFCLIVFSTQYLQYQMAPVAGRLMERLNITEQQYSTVFNAGTWPAIAFSIILGIITDRFGLKKTVIVCMIRSRGRHVARVCQQLFYNVHSNNAGGFRRYLN